MKKLFFIALMTTALMISGSLHAKNYTMLFWYPGEAGTTAEAAPVLTEFFDYLSSKLDGVKISGKYFNGTEDGLAEIKKGKPDLAIASYIALEENKASLPQFTPLASTRPLPNGDTTDQFVLVGKGKPEAGWTPKAPLNIISSIPVSAEFFKKVLAPNITVNVTIKTTRSIFSDLKKMAAGELTDTYALLTPMENHSLDQVSAEWKTMLAPFYKCKPIPTAKLVYFGARPEMADKLMAALLAMPSDPEGAEILDTLRLKGFK